MKRAPTPLAWLAAVLLAPGASLAAADAVRAAARPNIIIILADDLGYGDIRTGSVR